MQLVVPAGTGNDERQAERAIGWGLLIQDTIFERPAQLIRGSRARYNYGAVPDR
jgi:hypothetical protein